jgi:hypothetical protein
MAVTAVVFVVLGILLGVPLCIAIANDYFKRAGLLKRQCRSSEVLICEGRVGDIVAPPRERKSILRQIGDRSEVVLEVLRPSGLVWAINGRPHETWIIAPRARTAGPPEHARLAAQYVRPVETERGTFRLHQRLLSGEECAELRRYLPRIPLKGGFLALLFNVIAAAYVIAHLLNPASVPLTGVLMLALALWCDAQLGFAWRARRRMLKDLGGGFVVIFQPDPGATASHESVVEFLPHTGVEWTTGGRAAPWRRLHGTVAAG